MRPLPPLYPITDATRAEPLAAQITRFGDAGLPIVQFRGKPLDAKAQWGQLCEALAESHGNGGWPLICINDRADLAIMAAAEGFAPWGLHLGQEDLPHAEASGLPGLGAARMGASTHGPAEWAGLDPEVDHAGIGPFRATGTKPDHETPIGLAGLSTGCAILRAKGVMPVAIGGLTVADAEACFGAGAESLAMIGEAARAPDAASLGWAVQEARLRARPFDFSRGVVLTGSSGAGKTALGWRLAEQLGLPFHDLDGVVAKAEGRSITEIFAKRGEAAFRALEGRKLVPLLARPAVIALGGGAWETKSIRAAVAVSRFLTLWLAEPPGQCWARVAGDHGRPLARDREVFMNRHRARLRRWCELPSVSSFGRSPEELAKAMAP
jgi:thiamine-phosphate diphosphorylase